MRMNAYGSIPLPKQASKQAFGLIPKHTVARHRGSRKCADFLASAATEIRTPVTVSIWPAHVDLSF